MKARMGRIKNAILPIWTSSPLKVITIGAQIFLVLLGILFLVGGSISENLTVMLWAGVLIQLAGIFYALGNIRGRFLFLMFQLCVFIFLQIRPLIDVCHGTPLWDRHSLEGNLFALTSVPVSLLLIQAGSWTMEFVPSRLRKPQYKPTTAPKKQNPEAFQFAAFIVFLITAVFYIVLQCEKLVFMCGRDYIQYYTEFQSSLPGYVYTIGIMMPFALCVYLSTFPKKYISFAVLLIYILAAVPEFLVGMRGPIVLNILFAFTYYCLRDSMGDSQKWIGKIEKWLIYLGIPLTLLILSFWNYLRDGQEVQTSGVLDAIRDLLYKQGVSYEVLCRGFSALPLLPGGTKCYTFGVFIDQFTQGSLGQLILHTTPFPSGNSAIRAIEGNSFAHSMSYVAHEGYLDGHGWGSSYLLETYADFGWFGIVIYSFLLGALLIGLLYIIRKKWLLRSMAFVLLTNIFFIPRAEALGAFCFLTDIHFWAVILGCVLGGWILTKWDKNPFSRFYKRKIKK